ncbi:hypothetical protein HYH02_005968 [Chlamydomonas schloesseri]|uniref:Protein kinase domain-containing protein n=1 Tax=Chlamydomonas schloesseri TaxID=2026947 RepID=A0A835WLH8_9CHLO|nr:hypothetical protein HYH02_005968 [Chlamydomonas schloesseri]|eukprot:KAG2449221.1 hypothetical protein HYH02_005968 [Chlamydomonas schloesseri]
MAACGPSGHPAAAGCCNTSPSTQRQQPQQVHVHLRGEVAGAGLSRTVSDGAALAAAASSAALLPPPPPSQQQQQHQQVCVPHHMHLQQQPGVASRPLMPQPRAASAAAAAPLMTTMMMMGASPAPHAVGGFTLGTAVMAAANSSNGGSCGAGGGGGGGGGVERRPLQDNSPHMAAVASVPSRVGSGVPMPGSPYHTAAGGIPVACNNSYPAPPAPAPQHHAPPVAAVIITPPMALPVLSAPSPPAPVPATTLLAINPAVPASMRRHVWSLDDYNVAKRLYKSASSSVYKATCMHSGLPVALKVYFLAKVPLNVVHMIKREIELHVQLVHPHVIQLYGAFLDGDRIVLVQEYAARGDLLHLLRAVGGRMTEAQVSELVLAPFLQGVAYLHGRGVCHRDIKPENILFTADWALKIADLGVSINMNEERAVTRAGTMDYMAPEVCRCPLKAEPDENKDNDALAYTAAVDVWAAGVLAYELLVGFTPMVVPAAVQQAGHSFLTAQQATTASLHFPSSLSAAGRDFICGALSESPGDRPTARELLRHPWLLSAVRGGAAAAVGSATAVLGGAAAVGAAAGSLEASMPAATATAAVAAATAVGMESMSF